MSELRRVPPQKGRVLDLPTSPTCQGNSFLAAFVPPTILVEVTELTPHWQDPTTGGEVGGGAGGAGGGVAGTRQAWERETPVSRTERVESNMTRHWNRSPAVTIYTDTLMGHAGNG